MTSPCECDPCKRLNYRGFGFFASVTGVFCDGGLVVFFLRRSVLGVFCDSAGGVFCDSGRVFGYGKEGYLHQWGFCDGNRGLLHRHRSAAERSIKKANLCGRL